jgi:hypothetical protein
MDDPLLSTNRPANTAPTNDFPSYANGMEGINAPTNDSSPELDCTHLSTITVDSTNETHLHLNPGAPTGAHATPHLAMDRVGDLPATDCIVCLAMNNETQPETGCQYQAIYSNNTDNQGNHTLYDY